MTSHAALAWLLHHHMTASQIRYALILLVHQTQHLHLHRTTIWLTHIRGGRPGAILALNVKLGAGILSASWG